MVFSMIYRTLLIVVFALFVLNGCSQMPWAANQGYADSYPWVWEPSCNCWVNVAHNQPVAVATNAPCSSPCGAVATPVAPAPLPALTPCSANNPCQTAAKPRLRLLQTSTQPAIAPAAATVAVNATPAAANLTTPSYWDPNCNCWVTARYLNTTPSPSPSGSAMTTANEAKIMAAQALKASGETDEKINRMYQRLIQK